MTIVISSPRLHFRLVGIILRVHQLDITQMQAHRMFHAIELNTNGMLARSLTTGALTTLPVFDGARLIRSSPSLLRRIGSPWLEHSGLYLSNL